MEPARVFQTIKKWDDLAPYAGQIVAISDESSSYFARGTFSFSDISCTFAYVISKPATYFAGGVGYHLNSLNKPRAIESACIVNENTLAESERPLEMRLASKEELKRIRTVVISSSAVFSTLFCNEALEKTMAILDAVPRSWCSIV